MIGPHLFLPFHAINVQYLASWSIKLDMDLLNRQLLSDSLESLRPHSTLLFGGERENYENPRVEIIANGHFSSTYRDTQIYEGVLP